MYFCLPGLRWYHKEQKKSFHARHSWHEHSYSSQLETAATKMFITGRVAGARPGTGGAVEPRNQHFGTEGRESKRFLSFTAHLEGAPCQHKPA